VTGPAGTGKTWVLATAASMWDGPVFGTATSQNATNELRAAGVQVAANTTRLLADLTEGRIPPGSLILADEGSMISITHLAAVVAYAAGNGCKLVLAGDQEQLAAVEGGGAIKLPPTPSCAAATPATRSSRCAPPNQSPSPTPDGTASHPRRPPGSATSPPSTRRSARKPASGSAG
jgi:hypothetical protein